ncbi:MAG TPA: Calx-beta domain-containing protein, partial [Solirubrobacter sp.]|nr:Calx-beta domain-containing protein [Solirubrobacter sp.]
LTNRGTLRTAQGADGSSVINGDVVNAGTIQLDSPLRSTTSGQAGTWTNSGTVTVAAGVALDFDSGWGTTLRQTAGTFANQGTVTFWNPADVLAATGGAFTGTPPVLRQGALRVTGGSGVVAVRWGLAKLAADIGPNWTVRLEDRGSDWVRLDVPAGQSYTNRGTIAFARDPAPGADNQVGARINLYDGAKLTNEGLIRADADVAQPSEIWASQYAPGTSYKDPKAFVQKGTLQVAHDLTLPPTMQSGGTLTVDAGTMLTVGDPYTATDPGLTLAGGTLTGAGRVRAAKVLNSGGVVAPLPGATHLELSYGGYWDPSQIAGGDYVQTAGGTLRVRLAASGGGLAVGGDVKLAGALDVAASSPPAGQTYQVVRIANLPYTPHFRSGRFATVTGGYAPVYELDGADVTVPGGTSSLSIDDVTVREGENAVFTVTRSSGAGTAAVHWALREVGSAAAANADYGYGTASQPQSGDLTFAAGETRKTVAIQTYGDGTPEPDETFQIHLSHPVNVPIARADGTGTILNDDTDLASVAPNVLGNGGPVTLTLRGAGLTSRVTARLRLPGDETIVPALSYTGSDDGLSATVVVDTAGLKPSPNWQLQLFNFADTTFRYRNVDIQATTGAAQPFVQAVVAPYARGGVVSSDYLHYGNVGKGASRPAFLRFSGYPAGAELAVDHLPPGASYTVSDGVAGRSVTVSVGRIPAGANAYVRIGYTPTTTIPGHTKLSLQASMHFGEAAPALTDVRTLASATALTPGADERFASRMTFSPSGSLTLRYAEGAASGAAPAVTHSGTRWTFRGDIAEALAPAKARRVAGDPTQGLLTVDFNGGEFKISGPLQELEGAYELSIDRRRLTDCLLQKGLLDQQEFADLNRLADGAVVLKGLTSAADKAGLGYGPHLQVLDAVMSGAWERRLLGGKTGILDQIANPKWGFDLLQDDEYQMLWLAQLCNERDTIPEPEYDKNGNYVPSKYIKELLQSFDPNEKYGTQGGGALHAVRSDRRLDYTVGFQNLPAASAPAQTVTVTDVLDPATVDLSTFALGPIALAGQVLAPPAGVTSWTKVVDLGTYLLVRVEAKLTGSTAVWTFTSLDPRTLALTGDVTAGFLPPAGEGSVAYSVAPRAGIATGTTIAGSASIVFDTNAPIVTNVWSNLIDDVPPTGAVTSVTGACDGVDVRWAGSDAASGVASYDVWASIDGGAWTPWRMGVTATSARYPAAAGHTYRFDVQARDFAGNLQAADRADARGGAVDCATTQPDGGGGGDGGVPGGGGAPGGGGGSAPVVKPWIKLGKLPAKLKKGALAVPVSCPASEPGGCRGTLTLTTVVKKGRKRVTVKLGKAAFTVKPGRTATVSLKVSKAGLKRLRKGALKVALAAKGADGRTAAAGGRLTKVRR